MDKIPEKSATTKTLKRRYEKSEKREHCTVFQEERGPKCLMIIPSLGSKTLGTFRTLIAPAHWQGKHWIDNNICLVISHSGLLKINFFLSFMFSLPTVQLAACQFLKMFYILVMNEYKQMPQAVKTDEKKSLSSKDFSAESRQSHKGPAWKVSAQSLSSWSWSCLAQQLLAILH